MDNTIHQLDSLIANEFALEINGSPVSGIFGVSNLVTYATDEKGVRIKPPFQVTKMVERDAHNAFNQWLRETMDARDSDEKPSRNVTLVAVDDGVETRRWEAQNARIIGIRYSDFDNSSFEMVAETILIAYDDIVESWPASDLDA
ncbi:MAG: phage tail protein [Anaerolineae bacterium]